MKFGLGSNKKNCNPEKKRDQLVVDAEEVPVYQKGAWHEAATSTELILAGGNFWLPASLVRW
jgi:hypothetical protein